MKYSLGLDIGTTSVGWAVLNHDLMRIEALGVRAFNAAEDPKTRESLAAPRRIARGIRRTLRRRAGRMRRIKALLIERGLLASDTWDAAMRTAKDKPDPWQLRAAGLDRLLSGEEFARALYHIAGHRGFKSNRKKATNKEDGIVLESIGRNKELMRAKEYRTVGEMYVKDERFREHKRNVDKSYANTVERAMLEEEVAVLFACQQGCGNPLAADALRDDYLTLFRWQLPYASAERLLEKVGSCTFEKEEKRAPRMSYTAERFTVLQKINSLSYHTDDGQHRLDERERAILDRLAFKNATVTYAQIRKELDLSDDARFAGLAYSRRKGADVEETLDCEKAVAFAMRGYYALRKAYQGVERWEAIKDSPDTLDTLAYALTFYKTDDAIHDYLAEQGLPEELIAPALEIAEFSKVVHLSIKAMRKILPHLEAGHVYSEACALAGYDHSPLASGTSLKLPPLDPEEVRCNPVAKRALAQARKVVNAVIDRYGSPWRIHIEFGREIGKTVEERGKILKRVEDNRKARVQDEQHFLEIFNAYSRTKPSSEDLEKFRLYREQDGKCAYSGKVLEIHRLLDTGYAEVDHILPYSRSFDDGMANKVLVHTAENRNKKNRTPYEYFGHDEARWRAFEAWVSTLRDGKKRRNLLNTHFDEHNAEEWKQRSLTDTQNIAKQFAKILREQLRFAVYPDDADRATRVICLNGRVTALVRWRWGIKKDREESDLHHAADAAVCAALTPGMIKRITEYRQLEEANVRMPDGSLVNRETGEVMKRFYFPQPWPHFRREVEARLSENPAEEIAALELPAYTDGLRAAPVIVSRMPQRGVTGAIHKETIRSSKLLDDGYSATRKALADLKEADLPSLVAVKEDPRLYDAIRERLLAFGGDGKKAFAEPFHKPADGGVPGPLVKKVKITTAQNTGVPVRGGIADNGDMARVDVFRANGNYRLVPIYVSDMIDDEEDKPLPNKAILAHKNEEDWPVMDESDFLFSLYPYDLVRIDLKGKAFFGYYIGCDRSTAAIMLCQPNKYTEKVRIGTATASAFEKYEMNVLGEYYRVRKEKRRGLENRRHRQPVVTAG